MATLLKNLETQARIEFNKLNENRLGLDYCGLFYFGCSCIYFSYRGIILKIINAIFVILSLAACSSVKKTIYLVPSGIAVNPAASLKINSHQDTCFKIGSIGSLDSFECWKYRRKQ